MTISRKLAENKFAQEQLDKANEPKTRCITCKMETSPKMRCICSSGGGSGSSSGSQDDKKDSLAHAQSSSINSAEKKDADPIMVSGEATKNPADLSFDRGVINDLIKRNLLTYNDNKELGILTIKCTNLQVLIPEEKIELQKFMKSVVQAYKEFLKENGLKKKDYPIHIKSSNKDENITAIKISLSNPKLYDAFISKLINKDLVPTQAWEASLKKSSVEPGNKFNPSPFKMKPKPKGYSE